MSLVGILAALRARATVNAEQPARRVLTSGLGVHARPDGSWLLWRCGAAPSDREVEVIARDAKLTTGFAVRISRGKGSSSDVVYRLVTPLDDDGDFATGTLCKHCRARSLLEDNSGGAEYCPDCGHGTADPEPLEAGVNPREMAIDWDSLGRETEARDRSRTDLELLHRLHAPIMARFGHSRDDLGWDGQLGRDEATRFASRVWVELESWSRAHLERCVAYLEAGGAVGGLFVAVPDRRRA